MVCLFRVALVDTGRVLRSCSVDPRRWDLRSLYVGRNELKQLHY